MVYKKLAFNCKIYLSIQRTKVGHNDPIILYGKVIAQRIKGNARDNRLMSLESSYRRRRLHLDVGSYHILGLKAVLRFRLFVDKSGT